MKQKHGNYYCQKLDTVYEEKRACMQLTMYSVYMRRIIDESAGYAAMI